MTCLLCTVGCPEYRTHLDEFITFRPGNVYPNTRRGLGVTVNFNQLKRVTTLKEAPRLCVAGQAQVECVNSRDGNRNPQGFAWDPVVTGRLWESEHGPTAGDEINIIERGHNYGWGVATKGTQPGITLKSAPRSRK